MLFALPAPQAPLTMVEFCEGRLEQMQAEHNALNLQPTALHDGQHSALQHDKNVSGGGGTTALSAPPEEGQLHGLRPREETSIQYDAASGEIKLVTKVVPNVP
jgi:hypothetical protein